MSKSRILLKVICALLLFCLWLSQILLVIHTDRLICASDYYLNGIFTILSIYCFVAIYTFNHKVVKDNKEQESGHSILNYLISISVIIISNITLREDIVNFLYHTNGGMELEIIISGSFFFVIGGILLCSTLKTRPSLMNYMSYILLGIGLVAYLGME